MTKERYFSNFEKYLSIFGHRLECTKPESSRLQNIQDCVYQTAIQDVDELNLRCLTAVCADIKHSVIDKAFHHRAIAHRLRDNHKQICTVKIESRLVYKSFQVQVQVQVQQKWI